MQQTTPGHNKSELGNGITFYLEPTQIHGGLENLKHDILNLVLYIFAGFLCFGAVAEEKKKRSVDASQALIIINLLTPLININYLS